MAGTQLRRLGTALFAVAVSIALICGHALGATGGHCDHTGLPHSMEMRNEYNADSPDAARHSVREVRKYGAQVIKVCATGVDMANPMTPVNKPFEIVVTCP